MKYCPDCHSLLNFNGYGHTLLRRQKGKVVTQWYICEKCQLDILHRIEYDTRGDVVSDAFIETHEIEKGEYYVYQE